jgi:phosphocarrier protein
MNHAPFDHGGAATVRRTVSIVNKLGLHARAAAKFVKRAGAFDADITVSKNGMDVSGRSIMGLMMLAAGLGSVIAITANGSDAERAVDALAALVADSFEEA